MKTWGSRAAAASRGGARSSCFEEREQVRVDSILHGRGNAMRRTLVDFQRRARDELGRERGGIGERHDLVVVAVDEEGRHVETLEVFGEVRLRERLDAVVGRVEAGHHPLQPERVAYALR